jgi:transcriptional regulator with XRE-family HTH domain
MSLSQKQFDELEARSVFGNRIEQLRCKSGESQSGLAKKVGVSTTCVWNWEQGNTRPRRRNLKQLAEVLKVTPEYLNSGKNRSDAEKLIDKKRGLAVASTVAEQSVADLINGARESIAKAAGLPLSRVSIVLDYGG